MSSGEVVSGIFLSGDELLWMEQLSVGSGSNLINDGWLEIKEDGSWDMLASTSLGEEGVEGVVRVEGLAVGILRLLAVGLDAVLEAEQLPARVPDLATALPEVDEEDFAHGVGE